MSLANTLLGAADKAVDFLPEPAATIAKLALKAGAAFAEAGKDPVEEITRVLDADPDLKRIHAGWEKAAGDLLDDKFGRKDEIPPPADTDPAPTLPED